MSIRPIITGRFWKQVISFPLHVVFALGHFFSFFVILIAILVARLWGLFGKIPLIGRLFRSVGNGISRVRLPSLFHRSPSPSGLSLSVNQSYLINLALKNLMTKKTRTFVTILGMSVGVGIIVLLLSLGYGIERLVISKVASLDELKMIDVSNGENTALHLDQNLIDKIQKIAFVEKVVQLTSVVGKITYNQANTDIIVYASSNDFLQLSRVKVLKGALFSGTADDPSRAPKVSAAGDVPEQHLKLVLKTLSARTSHDATPSGAVAGIQDVSLIPAENGAPIVGVNVDFTLFPEEPVAVWKTCSIDAEIIGYTVRTDGGYQGEEYWGGTYSPFYPFGRVGYDATSQQELGKWVRANVPLYDTLSNGAVRPKLDRIGQQIRQDGCLQLSKLQLLDADTKGRILGISTSTLLASGPGASGSAALSEDENATDSGLFKAVVSEGKQGEMEVVELVASASASKTSRVLSFERPPSGQAVVSLGMLNLLTIPLDQAVGKKFNAAFIINKSLMADIEGKAITSETPYTITGVIDDAASTYFYIPLSDMDKLGIKNFSQVKVVVADQQGVAKVRKEIETLGFRTASTVDTVTQIEGLFANLRIVLGLLGIVALGVASLGMFNTLTVSLLERTREIGGMKTMGMVSSEVQDLFLAEAMILGLSGGIGGLALGYGVGHLISFVISIYAVTSGQGYLNLTYIPTYLIFFIIICSFLVGLLTGLYPAQRAKKISALNALRYE